MTEEETTSEESEVVTAEIDSEDTPLGVTEETTAAAAEELSLEEEQVALVSVQPTPDSEQVVSVELEEVAPLGTALPYTGQSSDVPVSVIDGDTLFFKTGTYEYCGLNAPQEYVVLSLHQGLNTNEIFAGLISEFHQQT